MIISTVEVDNRDREVTLRELKQLIATAKEVEKNIKRGRRVDVSTLECFSRHLIKTDEMAARLRHGLPAEAAKPKPLPRCLTQNIDIA